MVTSKIKFNQASFDYYILQITPDTEFEQIKLKLSNFKELDECNIVIVIDLKGVFDLEKLTLMINRLDEYVKTVEIMLHSILANDWLNITQVGKVPVVKLPLNKKSRHIFNKSLIIDEPVRSGVKIENDGDIVISNFVSDNAEIIASGNIHIYGEARGRLIAGSNGDKSARIFSTKFNAALISIGGIYKIIEAKLPDNIRCKPVMVMLDENERLCISPL